MGVRILAALRDLDPPAGGAEMSLATLLKGVSTAGPYAEDAPEYIPLEIAPDAENQDGWSVQVFQSSDRGEATALTNDSLLARNTGTLSVESLWSGLAWRLRNKSTGRPHEGLHRRHLRKRNRTFKQWLLPRLENAKKQALENGDQLLGVTQLHWSAGAAAAFEEMGIPYLVFVRDELQFIHTELYRNSLENAASVCGAGHGLLQQIGDVFNLRKSSHVPLPVDFAGRFGTSIPTREHEDSSNPRIAIIGVTPEKGYGLYRKLLPHLHQHWPEAQID